MTDSRPSTSSGFIDTQRTGRKMKFSLSDSDIQRIWDFVSEFIESNMMKQKGVNIPNFGLFSFNQVKLDIGQSKYVLIQRPLFQLSEKICQIHGLKQNRTQITGSVPVIQLNYSAIMLQNGEFSRDQVETCVRELVTAMNQTIAGNGGGGSNTEIVFTRIGRLQIRGGQVKFKFYKGFVSSLDKGGSVIQTMQNRPGTADSVMSERPSTRAMNNVIPLPRISSHSSNRKLPSIHESSEPFETVRHCGSENDLDLNNDSADVLKLEEEEMDSVSNIDVNVAADTEPDDHAGVTEDHENIDLPDDNVSPAQQQQQEEEEIEADDDNQESVLPKPKPPARFPLQSATCSTHHHRPTSSTASSIISTTSTQCTHRSMNQYSLQPQLCYVCHQRERRNVPVYTNDLEVAREAEEDKVLQSFQSIRDQENLAKEQEKMLSRKHEIQKAAAFNLGVAEAKKNQEAFRDPNMYRSYLFQQRPLTPPKIIKQNQLNHELSRQVEAKSTKKQKDNEDESFIDRLEQMQLAEDLVKQRELFLNNREKQKDLYKRALDTQINNKPVLLPRYEEDSREPVFGKNDVTQEKLLAKRQKAQEVLQAQMEMAEERKKAMLLKKLQEQSHEEKVLSRVKSDLLQDRAKRYEKSLQTRVQLEQDWEMAQKQKRERDMLERLKRSMPNDVLVHEQCDRYHRCTQCKRKVMNQGTSNIWKETYFIPGSRYIY